MPSIGIIVCAVFLIRFLNYGDTYDQYVKIINQGYDYNKSEIDSIENMVDGNLLIDFNRKEFKYRENYLDLARALLINSKIDIDIQLVQLMESSVVISTEEVDYEVEINDQAIFFDNAFIATLNSILNKLNSKLSIHEVYPDSIVNKQLSKITLLSTEEANQLSENGMLDRVR